MIKAVIFDIGGVLAYDIWEHLLFDVPEGLAARLDLDKTLVYKAAESLWEKYSYIPARNSTESCRLEWECWESFIERLNLVQSPDYFLNLSNNFVREVSGMALLLEELQSKRVDLLICSNNNEFFFQRQMNELGLSRFFWDERKIILSSRSGVSKADPSHRMFLDVIEALDCEPYESLFIDDRQENIERALECQLPALLFPGESSWGANYLRGLFQHLKLL